jgi:hypothetical protein
MLVFFFLITMATNVVCCFVIIHIKVVIHKTSSEPSMSRGVVATSQRGEEGKEVASRE